MRLSAQALRAKAAEAREHYRRCDLCGHHCLVDRTRGPAGRCQEGDGIFLAGAGVHLGEEPPLVGPKPPAGSGAGSGPSQRHGSGLVLIGGCNLDCKSCETHAFSLERRGLFPASESQLAGLFLELQKKGAANLNLVTPTHVLPALLLGLARAAEEGFNLPVVWNCGGYESLEALRLLDGVVDIYLPDAKYGDDALALALSGCPGYTSALSQSLREMMRQVGPLEVQEGLATRGVIVRHLVLPNGQGSPEKLMPLLAEISPELWLNLLSQYRPLHQARLLPLLGRTVAKAEVELSVQAARVAGMRRIAVDGRPVSGAVAEGGSRRVFGKLLE